MESLGFVQLTSLARHLCLFLLGRPGAGKSAEVRRIADGLVAGFAEEKVILFSCKEFSAALDNSILHTREWREAMAQSKPVRLILDGLDEGFLREPHYFDKLRRALLNLQAEHPHLRLLLTCRPAEWNAAFGFEIQRAWGTKDIPAAFTLQALLREDQSTLALNRGVTAPDDFMRWVSRNRFEEFSQWPRSLEWLADEFAVNRSDNLTYSELCRRRVHRGFGEDARIVDAGQAQKMEAWEHVMFLVAGVLSFCGHKGIVLGAREEDCLTLEDFFGNDSKIVIPGKPDLSREEVREAIQKASHLMEEHEGYYRFQNQSDLEFLAGTILAHLRLDQLVELFGCPDETGEWRVFPQLASVSANLAAQSTDFFNYLLTNDPRVLLRVDFGILSPERRRNALEAILEATERAQAPGGHEQHAHLASLQYSQIEEQLRPWLFGKSRSLTARDLAFDIARVCCKPEFWEEFWKAYSEGSDDYLVGKLPSVMMLFGRSWPESRLSELADSDDDSIAGSAMSALLDRGWKPRRLAHFLRSKNNEAIVSSYDLMLSRIGANCDPEDAVALLLRLRELIDSNQFGRPFERMAQMVVSSALDAMEREDVKHALQVFFIPAGGKQSFLLDHLDREFWAHTRLYDPLRRRAFLLALADAWPGNGRELNMISPSVATEDIEWLLETLVKKSGNAARVLSELACGQVWTLNLEYKELLDRTYSASSELRAQLPQAEGSGIYSTLVRLRSEAEERHRTQMTTLRAEIPCYNAKEQFQVALRECRKGKFEWWTQLCFTLSEPDSGRDDSRFLDAADVRRLPGWENLTTDLRFELEELAREFLLKVPIGQPSPRQIPAELFGVVFALSLHAPNLVRDSELRAAVTPVWCQAVLRSFGSDRTAQITILEALDTVAPRSVEDAWTTEFREAWDKNEQVHCSLVPEAWTPRLRNALCKILDSRPLQPESYVSGLQILAAHDRVYARAVALDAIETYDSEPDSVSRRTAIASGLFVIPELWPRVWHLFTADPSAAKQLLLEFARWLDIPEQGDLFADIATPKLAELYAFLHHLFPINKAPRHHGAFWYNSEDQIYQLHTKLQNVLEGRGAVRELSAIYKTSKDLGDAWWTGRSLSRARTAAHAERRMAPNATEFLTFLGTEGGTFISDVDSLQRAVLSSLRRFEKKLHPRHILRLWEENRPRSEEILQVEIADHLEEDLRRVIVNMEPKVEGRERADIRVECPGFALTIEVKLGHSADRDRGLRTAMKTQLRDGYLRKRNETHGVYVVGWFFCQNFRPAGLREMTTKAAAQKYFTRQAEALSKDGFCLKSAVIDCGLLTPRRKNKPRIVV